MSILLEGIEPDRYGRYLIPYKSKILGKEVTLTIPTENGTVNDWQLSLANNFIEREEELNDNVYGAILAYYQEEAEGLRLQFGEEYQYLVPPVDNVGELKGLLTPTGICIGELVPVDEAVGLLFECTWEEEHGLGVLINNWRVKEVGHQDVAFTI